MPNKKIVLAIDDNIQQLNEFKTILVKNYDLRVFKSASEAICFLSKNSADVILLDIEMPNISGFEFLEPQPSSSKMSEGSPIDDIKKASGYVNVPVIIVSGNTGQEFFKRAKDSKVCDVLTKPVSADMLIAAIEKAVS